MIQYPQYQFVTSWGAATATFSLTDKKELRVNVRLDSPFVVNRIPISGNIAFTQLMHLSDSERWARIDNIYLRRDDDSFSYTTNAIVEKVRDYFYNSVREFLKTENGKAITYKAIATRLANDYIQKAGEMEAAEKRFHELQTEVADAWRDLSVDARELVGRQADEEKKGE